MNGLTYPACERAPAVRRGSLALVSGGSKLPVSFLVEALGISPAEGVVLISLVPRLPVKQVTVDLNPLP